MTRVDRTTRRRGAVAPLPLAPAPARAWVVATALRIIRHVDRHHLGVGAHEVADATGIGQGDPVGRDVEDRGDPAAEHVVEGPIEGFDRLSGRGIFYGAARSEAANTHGLDIHLIGAGNSAGQAALFFSAHARSVTILYRGETLAKSMSQYLVDQLGTRANIQVRYRTEVIAAHGDTSLEAIDVRDTATGDTTRLESGGLFIFIGADAETAWLPPEIALDQKGYVLTGSDARAAGRWPLDRDPYLLETSVPGIFACGDVRFSPVKRVAAAVGEGSMAIAFVHQYLNDAEAA